MIDISTKHTSKCKKIDFYECIHKIIFPLNFILVCTLSSVYKKYKIILQKYILYSIKLYYYNNFTFKIVKHWYI